MGALYLVHLHKGQSKSPNKVTVTLSCRLLMVKV
jgi:hypothetical protein